MLPFWFSLTPPALTPLANRAWSVIAVAAIIAAVLIRALVVRRASRAFVARAWARVVRILATNGAILLVLLFFRSEGVPFFGARFWLLLLGIGDLVWIIVIVRHFFVRVPKQQREWEDQQQRRKYLKR